MNNQTQRIETELKEYLQNVVVIIKQKNQNPSEYSCFEELLLDNGITMPCKKLPKNIKLGKPKSCYYNCQQLAFKDSSLTYVEGMAIAADVSFPLAHAWLLSADGYAIDPTWGTPGRYYFGVPLSSQWVKSIVDWREQQGHSEMLSIFEGNHLEGFSLLKDGLPADAILKKG